MTQLAGSGTFGRPGAILSSEIETLPDAVRITPNGSSIYKGFCRSIEVSVEVPHQQTLSDGEFSQKIEKMTQCCHPNICLFLGACDEPGNIKIGSYQIHSLLIPTVIDLSCSSVSEYLQGSVEDLTNDKSHSPPLHTRMKWAKDAAHG
jgi:hypothetical protein